MIRTRFTLPLIAILAAGISAQDPNATEQHIIPELAAPVPSLSAGTIETLAAPAQDEPSLWKGALNFGGTVTYGNIERRAAALSADAVREEGQHRTTLKGSWNYGEQKIATATWRLDQRRTAGSAKHDYFFNEDKTTYGFVALDAENNFNQSIDLRLSATVGVGTQVIQQEDLKINVEVGVGYYSEDPRVGNKDEYAVGRAGWDVDWTMNEQWTLLNTAKYLVSLENADDGYGELDTRLRTKLGKNMFGQLQWLMQYDNTPVVVAGVTNERVDHTVLLSVGWTIGG